MALHFVLPLMQQNHPLLLNSRCCSIPANIFSSILSRSSSSVVSRAAYRTISAFTTTKSMLFGYPVLRPTEKALLGRFLRWMCKISDLKYQRCSLIEQTPPSEKEGATLTQNPPGRESDQLKRTQLNTKERGEEKKERQRQEVTSETGHERRASRQNEGTRVIGRSSVCCSFY